MLRYIPIGMTLFRHPKSEQRSTLLSKPEFSDRKSNPSEEPHIQREIDTDKTGTIRRYLRLADSLLRSRNDDSSSTAA